MDKREKKKVVSDTSLIEPYFEYLDHTADVQVHACGLDFREALVQLGYGLINYMTDLERVDCGEELTIVAQGHDELSLIYAFLDELLYQFHGERFVLNALRILDLPEKFNAVLSHRGPPGPDSPETAPIIYRDENDTEKNIPAFSSPTHRESSLDAIDDSDKDDVNDKVDGDNDNKDNNDSNPIDDTRYDNDDTNVKVGDVVEDDEDSVYQIRAVLSGERWDPAKHTRGTEIKAITYSNMQVHRTSRKTDIYVIIDI